MTIYQHLVSEIVALVFQCSRYLTVISVLDVHVYCYFWSELWVQKFSYVAGVNPYLPHSECSTNFPECSLGLREVTGEW